ncbi:MAG: hypothetical protein R3C49_17485 [Planctomycetaceae bacterium]
MSKSAVHSEFDEPVDERLTQLVSYLDGELDDTEQDAIERALIGDPEMRSHADILSRTWAMLDELEEVTVSRSFTQATLATVSTQMAVEKQTQGEHLFSRLARLSARYRILPCFLAGVIGTSAGLWVSHRVQERRQQSPDAVRDALVLQKLDLLMNDGRYRVIPDVDSLQKVQLNTQGSDSTATKQGN